MGKGNLKRILSCMLSFILVLSIYLTALPGEVKAAGAGTVTVTASKLELHRGDTVEITVSLSGNENAPGTKVVFEYDADMLELQVPSGGVTAGDAAQGATLVDVNTNTQGSITAVIMRSDDTPINGVMFKVQFKVKDTGKGSVNPRISSTEFTTIDYNTVTPQIVNNASGMKVVVPAAGISLNKTAASIARGASETLTASLTPADADSTVTWASSNESVASVAQDGTVTAKAKGTAKITAAANGKSASCTVTVNAPLNAITINGTATTIKKGTTTKLSVVYDPEDTTDSKAVTWTSSAPAVATVDAAGLVTAVSDGTATITAKVGTKTATYAITVQEIKLTGITIKNAATIHRGGSETLAVTYNPENTTDDRTVIWTSSDTEVATVDGAGKVTAKKIGSSKIKAQVGAFSSECTVTVDAPLESIVPTNPAIDMIKNQTAIVGYKFHPEDTTDSKTVTFTSSAPDVVSVDGSGELSAKKAGSAVITIAGYNNITAAVNVKVEEIPINKIVLDKQNAEVEKGQTAGLTAAIAPANNTDDDKQIRWESSDTSIATVSPSVTNSGETVTVTATNKGGKATITAKAANGTKASCEINVPIHIENISMDAAKTINRGATAALDVTYLPADTTDEKKVTWTSSDTDVATVNSQTGMIEALKKGTTNITATTANGKTAVTVVTVNENHLEQAIGDTIEFEKMDGPVLRNQKLNMRAVLNLDKLIEANQITDTISIKWTSSAPDVATVDQSGYVTGVKEGTTHIEAVITATDGEGNVVGEYTVGTDVEIKEIPLESIAFNKIIKKMQVGATDVLSVIYNPENTTDVRDVVWASSDESILSVADGKITALKAGKATITAKVGDKTAACEIEVEETKSPGSAGMVKKGGSTNADRGNARTGDNANIMMYLVLILASLVTMFVLQIRKRFKAGR